MSDTDRRLRFDGDATRLWLPIGTVLALIASAIGVPMWLSSQFAGLQKQLTDVSTKLERLEDKVNDRWTEADMQRWVWELTRDNQTLKIPPVAKSRR